MDKFVRKAQKHITEPVLGAAGVQPAGSSAGLVGGATLQGGAGGVLGMRVAQLRGRRKTGLPLTPYMVLAVTASRLYLFQAGMTWGVKKPIGSWARVDVSIRWEERALTRRLEIHLPELGEALVLEAPKSRGSGELLRAIGSSS